MTTEVAYLCTNHPVGRLLEASTSRATDQGSDFSVGIFPALRHTGDLRIGTPVATLPGASIKRSALGLVGLVSVTG